MDKPDTSLLDTVIAAGKSQDRQRKLNEVCRFVLRDFVGRPLTATLLAQAEATVRAALVDAIRAGTYVLPDGLALDRVVLGSDMRIKILFKKDEALNSIKKSTAIDVEKLLELARITPVSEETRAAQRLSFAYGNANMADASVSRETIQRAAAELDKSTAQQLLGSQIEKLKNRFEAVAAEIDDIEKKRNDP